MNTYLLVVGVLTFRLPAASIRQRPRHVIEYAKTTRQAILKYLAVLRWKQQVDVPIFSSASTSDATPGVTSFPTPQTNGDSNTTSPAQYGALSPHVGKGKARMVFPDECVKGRLMDARRITQFLGHQNLQYALSIEHLRHVSQIVEGLR